MMRALLVLGGLVMIVASLSATADPADAANPPPDFAEIPIADEIFAPISMVATPDGRIFVLGDAGQAWVVKNDQLLSTPLFDIRSKVDDVGDRGLQSIALDNNFAQNGFIYVGYTFDTNGADDGVGRNRVVRMTVTGDTASNEVVVFDQLPDADVLLHYGGAIEHGSDGKLYVTVGDYLLGRNGQDTTNIKGTVLRLNTNGTIPTDNPFYNEFTGVNRAIYAFGLRNPWQTSEHPTTGDIFISDVGADLFEELNVLEAGANYGWFEAEGPKDPNDPTQNDFTDPLWAYPHSDNAPNDPLAGCAIIGGSFYVTPNASFPAQYHGKYFTGDYCQGTIVTVDPNTGAVTPFMDGFNFGLVDMAVNPVNGDLYFIDQTFNDDNDFPRGGIGKITYVGPQTDITITSQPTDVSIAAGGTASFFVGATAPGDVTYQWLRNGVEIPGATGPRLTIPNVGADDNFDRFRVDVSNGVQTVRSDPAVLRLTNNTVPVPTISFGGANGGYKAGTPITFSGSATDAEDGQIPASSLRWEIRLNHDDHDHELQSGVIGAGGTFTVPRAIETSTNVWVTLYLTATDSEGTSTTVTQRIDPDIVSITLASDPNGLNVALDGNTQQAPYTFDSVVGVQREISAPATQSANGQTYTWQSWSDGLGRNAVRITPGTNTTWTANYTSDGGGDVCSVTAIAGGVRITWTNKPGTEVIRNAGGWVATPAAGTTSFDSTGSVNDGWLIRRSGVDETCDIDGGGGGGEVCTVTATAGGVRVEWTNKPGTEVIRNNDGWVTTPAAGTTSWEGPGNVNNGWLIRRDGVNDEPCDVIGGPGGGPTCTVTAIAAGVQIEWDDSPAQNRYPVRKNGAWLKTVTGTSTTDSGTLNDNYVIQYDAGDGQGRQPLACDPEGEPPPVDSCFVSALPGGGVRITWQNKDGTEVLRNAGGWVATPPAGQLTYDAPNGSVNDGWLIRRPNRGPDEVCDIN